MKSILIVKSSHNTIPGCYEIMLIDVYAAIGDSLLTNNYVRPNLYEELSAIIDTDNEAVFLNVNAVNNFILNFIMRYQGIENGSDSEIDDITDQVYAAIFLNAVRARNEEVIEHIYEIRPDVILVADQVRQIIALYYTINDDLELKKRKVLYDDGKENKYPRYDDDSDDDNIGEMLFSSAEGDRKTKAKIMFEVVDYDSALLNDYFSMATMLSSVASFHSFSFVGSIMEFIALDEVTSHYGLL